MNFEEIVESLPNGFHDAELIRFAVDYTSRSLEFTLNLWVADDVTPPETYRQGVLSVSNVGYFVVEAPDACDWKMSDTMVIDAGAGTPNRIRCEMPSLPDGHFAAWMYLEMNNSFLLFSATNALFRWTSESLSRVPRRQQES